MTPLELLRQTPRGKKLSRLRIPRWLFPDRAERHYMKGLQAVVAQLEAEIIPGLMAAVERAQYDAPRRDADRIDGWRDIIKAYIASRRVLEIVTPQDEKLVEDIGKEVTKLNAAQLQRFNRAIFAVDVVQSEPWLAGVLDNFSNENAQLITSIKSTALDRVQEMAIEGVRNGRSNRDIARDIEEQFAITRRRANLIARDQVAKLNGQLTQNRQTALGVTQYKWRTSKDERVRQTHREHEGQIYDWSNPPAGTGHPGQDFQCRCWAEPVLDD